MIKKELEFVYITKDGKRFLNKNEANKHNELLEPESQTDQWLKRIKGEK